jgi:hypothetical protein
MGSEAKTARARTAAMPLPALTACTGPVTMSVFWMMYSAFSMVAKPSPATAPYTAPSMTASNRSSR